MLSSKITRKTTVIINIIADISMLSETRATEREISLFTYAADGNKFESKLRISRETGVCITLDNNRVLITVLLCVK